MVEASPPSIQAARCPDCARVFLMRNEGVVVTCAHCGMMHPRTSLRVLEEMGGCCPGCGEADLDLLDAGDLRCPGCERVYGLDPANERTVQHQGRIRHYSPRRGLESMLLGRSRGEAAPGGAGGNGSGSGALVGKSAGRGAVASVPSSRVVRAMRGRHWLKVAAVGLVAVVIAVLVLVSLPVGNGGVADASGGGSAQPDASTPGPVGFSSIEEREVRQIVEERLAGAQDFQDLLPMIRHRPEVEPLMRAYYKDRPFLGWAGSRIEAVRAVAEPGERAVRVDVRPGLPGAPTAAVLVKEGAGWRLDWERSVNFPLDRWRVLIDDRSLGPREQRVVARRLVAIGDALTAEEARDGKRRVAMSLGMPGHPARLVAITAATTALGEWIIRELPADEPDRKVGVRLELRYDPVHEGVGNRVVVNRILGMGWDR